MIAVHRLRGDALLLNPDLIEAVEATPDTVVTLLDGRKALVRETPAEIVRLIRDFRASVLARAESLVAEPASHLSVVTEDEGWTR